MQLTCMTPVHLRIPSPCWDHFNEVRVIHLNADVFLSVETPWILFDLQVMRSENLLQTLMM